MNIRYNCLFFPAKEPGRDDARLKLRVRWSGQTVCFNPGYRISLKGWSTETQRCRPNTFHGVHKTPASKINREIQSYLDAVDDAFASFEKKEMVPNKDELRHSVESSLGLTKSAGENNNEISHLFDKFMQSESVLNSWSVGTEKKMRTIKTHLSEFMPGMSVNDLTNETMSRLVKWFVDKGYRNATIIKELAIIRWFIRWMYRNGYYDGRVHETFSAKVHNYDRVVVYLSWDELISVCNVDLSESNYLDNIRNVFCFCCFTSLRYSDVYSLTWDDIKDDAISIVTKKTTDMIRIDLNKHSRAILDKYRGLNLSGNRVFPVYQNQPMNRGLKVIGKKAGLFEKIKMVSYNGNRRIEEIFEKWQLLTMHCARRTFVVNAMFLGIPEDVIRSWTGHSDSDAMKPYKKVVDELKRTEMDKFDRD